MRVAAAASVAWVLLATLLAGCADPAGPSEGGSAFPDSSMDPLRTHAPAGEHDVLRVDFSLGSTVPRAEWQLGAPRNTASLRATLVPAQGAGEALVLDLAGCMKELPVVVGDGTALTLECEGGNTPEARARLALRSGTLSGTLAVVAVVP